MGLSHATSPWMSYSRNSVGEKVLVLLVFSALGQSIINIMHYLFVRAVVDGKLSLSFSRFSAPVFRDLLILPVLLSFELWL
jgi:hypothetical protein